MIPMPYILVNMVLETFSLILFCTTGAALLSKYPLSNSYLPGKLRTHRIRAFVAQGLVLSAISIVVVLVAPGNAAGYVFTRFLFSCFFYVGLANSIVLTYQLLDGRYLLNVPKVRRRLLIVLCAVVMPSAAIIAVIAAVVGLFTIR
jgi:hypothetical protein